MGGSGYLYLHYWPPVDREPAINVDMVNIELYIYFLSFKVQQPHIYIVSVFALDETNISGCLHFSMQNIEMSCDLYCTSRRSKVNISQ